jgi:hypothetical protein
MAAKTAATDIPPLKCVKEEATAAFAVKIAKVKDASDDDKVPDGLEKIAGRKADPIALLWHLVKHGAVAAHDSAAVLFVLKEGSVDPEVLADIFARLSSGLSRHRRPPPSPITR